jgi:hypothetical protein
MGQPPADADDASSMGQHGSGAKNVSDEEDGCTNLLSDNEPVDQHPTTRSFLDHDVEMKYRRWFAAQACKHDAVGAVLMTAVALLGCPRARQAKTIVCGLVLPILLLILTGATWWKSWYVKHRQTLLSSVVLILSFVNALRVLGPLAEEHGAEHVTSDFFSWLRVLGCDWALLLAVCFPMQLSSYLPLQAVMAATKLANGSRLCVNLGVPFSACMHHSTATLLALGVVTPILLTGWLDNQYRRIFRVSNMAVRRQEA